jgi:prophage maintenance system killer protein
MAMAFWLEREGFRLDADRGQLRDIALEVAAGKMQLQELASRLRLHAADL